MRPNNPRRLGPRILHHASHRSSTEVWHEVLVSCLQLSSLFSFFLFFFYFEINLVDFFREAPLHQVCDGLRREHLVRIDPHSSC